MASAIAFPVWRLLREARQKAGLSQREVARRAGTSQAAVARYETARTLPDLDTLQRVLLASGHRLGLSITELDPDSRRQLRESVAMSPRQRVDRNGRMTQLAARAGAARAQGRVRPLVQG